MSGIIRWMYASLIHPLTYQVATPVYEGPLDLLLQLIERAELDITRLALAQVTDQYLEYIRALPELHAEEVSAFLVIAARLIQIKSEALLPRPPVRLPGEVDPGEALAQQLILYRRYKRAAGFLSQRQDLGQRTYLRTAPPPTVEAHLDLSGLSLADLVQAARDVYLRRDLAAGKESFADVVVPARITIRQKIGLIAQLLRTQPRSSFRALLGGARTRVDIVVTFLAMLELVKLHLIRVRQERLFGEIELEAMQEIQLEKEIELEFGE